jgi:hypothetical protein
MEGWLRVYINRAKALLLVGTISAGCASANDDEGPGNAGAAGTAAAGTGGSSSAGRGGTGGGAGTAGAPSAGAGGSGGTSTGGTGPGGGGTAGTPSLGGPDAGGPDAGNPDAGNPDAGGPIASDAGGDGGTCDDSGELVITCDNLDQNDCSGLESLLSSDCEMLEFILKPVAANAARSCMIELEPPELCDISNTYSCIVEALGASCPDAEAADECTTIATECENEPSFSACSSLLSGMTQDGRDQMVACATVACDLFVCIEGLSY